MHGTHAGPIHKHALLVTTAAQNHIQMSQNHIQMSQNHIQMGVNCLAWRQQLSLELRLHSDSIYRATLWQAKPPQKHVKLKTVKITFYTPFVGRSKV